MNLFVNDLVDWSLIKKQESNFTCDNQIFNIKDSINEIIEIMEEKAQKNAINIRTKFINFPKRN